MKSYKRLTKRITASNTGRTVLVIPTFRHEIIEQTKRLAELEDKIESGELCEREESEWKHRAEAAEDELARHKRALRIAGDKFINEVCNMRGEDVSDKCDYKCDTCFYEYYIQQAEKELEGEKKE